ncbi:MAG: CRISPR-associated endonuclease Cas1 [Candidatus Bathyarchaeia archaeon]
MGKEKAEKIILSDYGCFLGMQKGCYILKDRHGNIKKFPQLEAEIGEVVLMSGNMVSTGVLASFGYWDIDVLVATRNGKPVAILKSLDDDSHVKTRICQYEAFKNGKSIEIAKTILKAKIEGQNQILKKYGLKQHDIVGLRERINALKSKKIMEIRRKLIGIEGKHTKKYFNQIFQLFPEPLRVERRRSYKAYDGINNLFNLAYEILYYKCYQALIKTHLEPFLGFVHALEYSKPSLVLDFQEVYRYLVDDFVIEYAQDLKLKDFISKTEIVSRDKLGKRIYLNNAKTKDFLVELHGYFKRKVDVPRIKHGFKCEIETLIFEEAMLLAKYLRNERQKWFPRIVNLS